METIVVTGGRDYEDYSRMCRVLDQYEIGLIVHGAAPGADSLASRYAYERKINVRAFGAKWGRYGSAAGGIRNGKMLRTFPDALVVAFPTPKSKGTWDCVRKAKSKGMRLRVIKARRRE